VKRKELNKKYDKNIPSGAKKILSDAFLFFKSFTTINATPVKEKNVNVIPRV
jgi:hypothetical protein